MLLDSSEPAAVEARRANGRSALVLACDHAGNAIPRRLGTLGLAREILESHIAWDIGALGVARCLSTLLDAPLVWQTYSRLVIDCNRGPCVSDFIPTFSDDTPIPYNRTITPEDRRARMEEIFRPYHQRLAGILDMRESAARLAILVAIHSFTPVFKGAARPWHVGILYNRDPRLASLLLEDLRARHDLCVGDNHPYFVSDETDYTIPVHGEARGIPHVEIEIRQDLISCGTGQEQWAGLLADCLWRALPRLAAKASPDIAKDDLDFASDQG
jgi:predicted N-formylglutamate amidohydrolase